ncbi:MAG: hypothetical protein ACRDA3_14255 [Peptostreptococcaceae bacterium]
MKNTTNVISLRKKRLDKKYGTKFRKLVKSIKNLKYHIIFIIIPLLIVGIFLVNRIIEDIS